VEGRRRRNENKGRRMRRRLEVEGGRMEEEAIK
jgi:hypothetical protein